MGRGPSGGSLISNSLKKNHLLIAVYMPRLGTWKLKISLLPSLYSKIPWGRRGRHSEDKTGARLSEKSVTETCASCCGGFRGGVVECPQASLECAPAGGDWVRVTTLPLPPRGTQSSLSSVVARSVSTCVHTYLCAYACKLSGPHVQESSQKPQGLQTWAEEKD